MTTAHGQWRWLFPACSPLYFSTISPKISPGGASAAKSGKRQACSCETNRRKSHVKRIFALFLYWCEKQCRRPGPVRVLQMAGRAPPPARITRTGPLAGRPGGGFGGFVGYHRMRQRLAGTGGGLVYYYIPHSGTHREHRGPAIAALLCGPLVACRPPPGDLKNTTNPLYTALGPPPPPAHYLASIGPRFKNPLGTLRPMICVGRQLHHVTANLSQIARVRLPAEDALLIFVFRRAGLWRAC